MGTAGELEAQTAGRCRGRCGQAEDGGGLDEDAAEASEMTDPVSKLLAVAVAEEENESSRERSSVGP
jgi:hypothetical protein